MTTTAIPAASLESYAKQRSGLLHEHRVRAFDAAVLAYLGSGPDEADQTLERLWVSDPDRSDEDDERDRACFRRALRWMSRDQRLLPERAAACEPFTLERRLPTGERYALQGRVDVLDYDRGRLVEWRRQDAFSLAIPAAFAVSKLDAPVLRLNRRARCCHWPGSRRRASASFAAGARG